MQILIKNIDRSQYYKTNSLNLNLVPDGESTGSITLIKKFDDGTDFSVECGQEIHILPYFRGIIHTVKYKKIEAGLGTDKIVEIQVDCFGYSNIPQRRTISGSWNEKYAGEIVEKFLSDTLLAQEGITLGTIQQGIFLQEYDAYAKSIKDILDDLAKQSNYKWYITPSRTLFFGDEQDVFSTALKVDENMSDVNCINFSDVEYEKTLEDYKNKQFVLGGISDNGNPIMATYEDLDEQLLQVEAEGGGSGVYGNVITDESIEDAEVAMDRAIKEVQRYGKKPSTLKFTTLSDKIAEVFENNTRKISVNIPTLGISNAYFTITQVNVREIAPLTFECEVTAQENATAYVRKDFIKYYNEKFEQLKKTQDALLKSAQTATQKTINGVNIKDDKLEIHHLSQDMTNLNLQKDGTGKITKITNPKTGKSIDIWWGQ